MRPLGNFPLEKPSGDCIGYGPLRDPWDPGNVSSRLWFLLLEWTSVCLLTCWHSRPWRPAWSQALGCGGGLAGDRYTHGCSGLDSLPCLLLLYLKILLLWAVQSRFKVGWCLNWTELYPPHNLVIVLNFVNQFLFLFNMLWFWVIFPEIKIYLIIQKIVMYYSGPLCCCFFKLKKRDSKYFKSIKQPIKHLCNVFRKTVLSALEQKMVTPISL